MIDETTPENTIVYHSTQSGKDWSVNVRVVEKQGRARVIEYRASDGLHRCILPANVVREALAGDGLTEEELERGVSYGEDWAEMLHGVEMPTPETVAQVLRDAGIWTAEEARANVGATRAAIARVYAPVTTAILRGSRAIQKGRR